MQEVLILSLGNMVSGGVPLPPEAHELQKQLRDAERLLADAAEKEQHSASRSTPAAGRSPMSRTTRLSMAGDGTSDASGLWEYLKYLAHSAWCCTCEVCSKLRLRGP